MPIYAFGSNGSGQLGIGHTDDVCTPTRCFFSTAAGGGNSTTIDNDTDNEPDTDTEIRRIAAGGNHTVILYASGAAYAAGMNGDGRCGVDDHCSDPYLPPPSPDAAKSGLEGEGEERGRFARVRLGLADGRIVDRFADVSASWAATVFVALGGREVYVMGSGEKGELGMGEQVHYQTEPRVIPDFPPAGLTITAIASGMSHVVCVLSNGHVYGWGAARKGQLGHAEATVSKIVWTPVRIEDVLFRADGVACGREFTVVVNYDSGEYVVLGSDKWGIVSGAAAAGGATAIKGRVSASWHGVYIHNAAENSLLAWGRNDRGQLPPPSLTGQVAQFAAGSEHAVALLSDQTTVVSFGWGEHGNCGAAVDSQGNVKDRFNEIPLLLADNERVTAVAAGCATSWIVTRRG
ncbi:hypothetical protein PISL3812_03814 [Talaromyces islandicus]|uniref:RCC1-like domain-containing protein n=1 Tax=Talaromyces islandicus TaxID=28573 RepID=A0A0U1LUM5_TALIS|nr:hypothetical protein PISL3812_03814 [Talaromyces islandicus]